MFPVPQLDLRKEQHTPVHAIVKQIVEEDGPHLDLGKKVSVPQDLMVEELSLPINRGSRLYQKRQKRVQRFVLEPPVGYHLISSRTAEEGGSTEAGYDDVGAAEGRMSAHNAEWKENSQDGPHSAASGGGGPPKVPKKTSKVFKMSKALNPNSIAPGYNGPLKEVPHEKFNRTAIPKGYQSPWQEFLSSGDYKVDSENRLPEPPRKVSTFDVRSFNRTPTPFGGPVLNDAFPRFEMGDDHADAMNSLELMSNRPSFNRTPLGWIQVMPESEDL
uniref:Myozenin-3 n=1 Tax=Pogona vitticeps TaxID=103695 RepID=A0A6J0UYA4_9SAUR